MSIFSCSDKILHCVKLKFNINGTLNCLDKLKRVISFLRYYESSMGSNYSFYPK